MPLSMMAGVITPAINMRRIRRADSVDVMLFVLIS
jgi:hypothetical protein